MRSMVDSSHGSLQLPALGNTAQSVAPKQSKAQVFPCMQARKAALRMTLLWVSNPPMPRGFVSSPARVSLATHNIIHYAER